MRTVNVRIPQIASVETAIRIYYEHSELSSADIVELFGSNTKKSRVTKLKNKAREISVQNGTQIWNAQNVNTADAFAAWGLDIADLERRAQKLYAIRKRSGEVT